MNYNKITFDNVGIVLGELPTALFKKIVDEVDEIEKDFTSTSVMISGLTSPGVAPHYNLNKNLEELNNYLLELITAYNTTSTYLSGINILTSHLPFYFKQPWVNFQSANEFIPNHNHEGILSYVLWVKIPPSINNEKYAGKLEFTYTDILGRTVPHEFNLDNSYEGKLLLFPAGLRHCVYPFSNSNEYRISVSGNILLGN